MDRFRFQSQAFADIPWHTDILCAPDGIEKLKDIEVLRVSSLICFRRHTEAL